MTDWLRHGKSHVKRTISRAASKTIYYEIYVPIESKDRERTSLDGLQQRPRRRHQAAHCRRRILLMSVRLSNTQYCTTVDPTWAKKAIAMPLELLHRFEIFFLSLTIAIFIKEAKGLLELGNLLFGQLISHGGILIFACVYFIDRRKERSNVVERTKLREGFKVVVVGSFFVFWRPRFWSFMMVESQSFALLCLVSKFAENLHSTRWKSKQMLRGQSCLFCSSDVAGLHESTGSRGRKEEIWNFALWKPKTTSPIRIVCAFGKMMTLF